MPLQSVLPPSIPLRYQLLHDTITCLVQSADLACTALLLYYYYTRELYGYFNATVTLVSLASLFLTLHYSHVTRSNSLLLFLYMPAAFTAPFLILLAAYRVPPWLPRSLLPSMVPPAFSVTAPAGAVDNVKQYQLYTLYRHSGFHFHAMVWTVPVSLVTLVYVASHQHETDWLPIAALLVHLTVVTSRLWMFAFSIHTPTQLFLLLCIAADVLNLYSSVLLLSASTATQPVYHVWFFSSYTHATLFNSILLNKDFTLFLLFAFTFLCMTTFGLIRQLAIRMPLTAWWVLLVLVQYAFVVMSFVLLFAAVVALLFELKCLWLVILVYCVVLYEQWAMPVFYRRLYAFLTASSTFASSAAGSTWSERVYAANQYFAQRCLTLYPPPVCTTPTKRQWVGLALHVLSLQPSEFDAAALMRRADAGAWVGCKRTIGAIQAQLAPQPTDLRYQRIGRLVGCLVFYVCLPCYAASVLWDIAWPVVGAVYLAAYGGCEEGGGLLAVIVGCVYGAVLLAAVLLLPSVIHFHSVIDSVLRYDLPRVQHTLERRQPDKNDQPALPCYPHQLDNPVSVTQREDDWQLLPFNVEGDTLNDWPYQISSLLYSRLLRTEARNVLVSGGMVEAVSDMVVSYLPAMEREREGQEAEDGEWMERRRRRQWLAVREPQLTPPLLSLDASDDETEDEKEDSAHTAAQIELVIRSAPVEDEGRVDESAVIDSPPVSPPPPPRPAALSLGAYDRWRLGLRGPAVTQPSRALEQEVEEGGGGARFERMREEDSEHDEAVDDTTDEKQHGLEAVVVGRRGVCEPQTAGAALDDSALGGGRGGGSGRGRGGRLSGSFDETKLSRNDVDDKHYRLLDIHEQD